MKRTVLPCGMGELSALGFCGSSYGAIGFRGRRLVAVGFMEEWPNFAIEVGMEAGYYNNGDLVGGCSSELQQLDQ